MPRVDKRKYVDEEADADSGSDNGADESGHESGADDSGAESEASLSSLEGAAKGPKGPKGANGAGGPKGSAKHVAKKAKILSNKTIDPKAIPAKPTATSAQAAKAGAHGAASQAFEFRLVLTNGQLLRKFLEPVSHSVKKMKFMLTKTKDFTGFRMEAHDAFLTLANKSRFECDVEGPSDAAINESVFCVSAGAFMQALSASTLKDTTLSITKYTDGTDATDAITFEAVNNESDVRTVYTCSLLESTQVQSLDKISLNLGFHVNVHMSVLKELSLNARKCGAGTLAFDLWQAVDDKDPTVVHSKMTIGFEGIDTSGTHEFVVSAKKTVKTLDGKTITSWEPLAPDGEDKPEMVKKCHNEYDNNKLRVFLNHMECTWVLVHLCNDNTEQPLVLEFVLGSKNTNHAVIVAPKMEN